MVNKTELGFTAFYGCSIALPSLFVVFFVFLVVEIAFERSQYKSLALICV